MAEAVDFQADPAPFKVVLPNVGTYEIEVILVNRRSYVTATVHAEADVRPTGVEVTWNPTAYGQQTCLTVSALTGTRFTVFWVLDDTYALENYAETYSDLQQLCHQYTTKGFYDTELRISNSLYYDRRTIVIPYVDPLVGFTFTAPACQTNGQAVDFVRAATSGSHVTCEVEFGDGNLQIVYEEADPSSSLTFSNTYPQAGSYYWTAMCTNYLTTVTETGIVSIQDTIEDLEAKTEDPKILGGDLRVNFSMSQGTNVSCSVKFKASDEANPTSVADSNIFYSYGDATGYALIPETDYTTKNYTITVDCSNCVSTNVQATTTVGVDKVIQGTKVRYTGPQSPYGRRDTVDHPFSVETLDGSRYHYSLDWGDGTAASTGGSGIEVAGSQLADFPTHTWASPGYYVVTLFVWNYVSAETHAIEVGIEDAIDNFFTMGIDANATFVDVDDVDIQLNWSPPGNEPRPTSVLCTINYRHDEETSDKWLDPTSNVHHFIHSFPYYTYYEVSIYCHNNISSQDLTYTVRVGEEIEGLHIEFPSNPYNKRTTPPAQSEFTEELAELTFGVSKGSNIRYTVEWGDGLGTEDVNRTDTQWHTEDSHKVTYSIPNPGDWTGKVRAINNLTDTELVATTAWSVNAENPVPTLTMDDIPPQNLNGTAPAEITLRKESHENIPTDASCDFSYPDMTTETVSMDSWTTGDTITYTRKDIVWPGPHVMACICYNQVTTKSVSQDAVHYQREITNVREGKPNRTYEQGDLAQMWLEYDDGSHMYIDIHFGDGERETITEFHGQESGNYMLLAGAPYHYHLDWTHRFPEGNFTCTFRVYNNVSDVTITAAESFIIQYKIEDVNASVTDPLMMVYPSRPGRICVDANLNYPNGPTDVFCKFTIVGGIMQRTVFCPGLRNKTMTCMEYTFPFNALGPRRIDYNCSNYIQYVTNNIAMFIVERLDNITLSTVLTPAIIPCFYNVSQMITVTVRVNNGSDFDYQLSTNQGGTMLSNEYRQQSRFEPFIENMNISYPVSGNFKPSIFCENDVSQMTCFEPGTHCTIEPCQSLTIEYPVPQLSIWIENEFPGKGYVILKYPPGIATVHVIRASEADHITNPNVTISINGYEETMATQDIARPPPNGFTQAYTLPIAFEPDDRELLGENVLMVNVSNNVSSRVEYLDFVVQEIIVGLTIVPYEGYLAVGESLVIMANVSLGTHITYDVNFDATSLSDQNSKQNVTLDPLGPARNHSFNHTYWSEGNYTVSVVASNAVSNVSNAVQFCVMQTIGERHLTALNKTVTSDESIPAVVTYSICFPSTALVKPCHVFITWVTGDGSSTEVIYTEEFCTPPDFCFHKVVTLSNFPSGTLNTTVELKNEVSNYSSWDTVDVFHAIKEVAVGMEGGVVSVSGDTGDMFIVPAGSYFNFTCRAGKGSDISVQADYGDGNVSEVIFIPGYQLQVIQLFSHMYNTNGSFSLTCNFTNIVDGTLAEVPIYSQWPVIESAVVVEVPSAVANPPGIFNFFIDFSLSDQPHTYLTIKCGDTVTDPIYIDSWPQSIEFDINTKTAVRRLLSEDLAHVTGDVNITLIFDNDVSHIEYIIPVHFDQLLSNVSLTCPPNATSGGSQRGISTNRLETFALTKTEGTSSSIKINDGNGQEYEAYVWNELEDDMTTFNLSYEEDGDYTVSAFVFNTLSNVTVHCMVSAFDPVPDLVLTADLIEIIVNNTIDFTVAILDENLLPSRAHFALDANDTNPAEGGEFLTSDVTVTRLFQEVGVYDVTARVWNGYNEMSASTVVSVINSCRSLQSFNVTKLIQVNRTATFNATLNGPAFDLCMTFVYTQEDDRAYTFWRGDHYMCSGLPGFNEDGYNSITGGASIVRLEAKFPDATILTISLTLTTLCEEKTTLYTANVTIIPCLVLDFITDTTGQTGSTASDPMIFKKKEVKEIAEDFFSLSTDCVSPVLNCKFYINDTGSLTVDTGITLLHQQSAGKYSVEGDGFQYANYVIDCMGIMPLETHKNSTKLFYFMISASAMTITINNDALRVLKGISEEIELSVESLDPDEDETPAVYEWYCWRKDQEEQTDVIDFPQSLADVPSGTGGCFGDQSGKLDGASGTTLTLRPDILAVETYIMKVVIRKGSRTASDDIEVDVKDAPQLQITVEITWAEGMQAKKQLKPGEDAEVCATCDSCLATDTYTWVVSSGDVEVSAESLTPLPENTFIVVDKCITLFAQHVRAYTQYAFQCSVLTAEGGGGEGSTKTCSADIPTTGKLTVLPLEGQALTTLFSFEKSGWSIRNGDGCTFDPPGEVGLTFTILQMQGRRGEWNEVALSSGRAALPSGPQNEGNVISAMIKVETDTGISVESNPVVVKVVDPPDPSAAMESLASGATSNAARISALSTLGSFGDPGSVPSSPDGDTDPSVEADFQERLQAQEQKRQQVMVLMMTEVLTSNPDPGTLLAVTSVASGTMPLHMTVQMAESLSSVTDRAQQEAIANNILLAAAAGADDPTLDAEELPTPPPVDLEGYPDEEAEEAAAEAERIRLEEERKRELERANSIQASAQTILKAVSAGLAPGERITVGSASLQLTVLKQNPDNIEGQEIDTPGGKITMGGMASNDSTSIRLDVVFSAINIFSYDASASQVNGGITMFNISADDGSHVPYPDLTSPVGIGMNLNDGANNQVNMDNVTTNLYTLVFSLYFSATPGIGALILHMEFGLTYRGVDVCVDIYATFNITETSTNQPNRTYYDYHATLPHSHDCNRTEAAAKNRRIDASPETDWIIVIPEKYLGPPGFTVAFAVRVGDDPKPVNVTPTDMRIRNAITRCRSWNNLDEEWTTESCTVGLESTLYSTECKCGKLTEDVKTFSGGITLPTVNTIDFANIFANFLDLLNANPTVMATLLTIFCCYILLLVWARRKDKQDIERWGVTPLVDNIQDSTYFFKLSVYTGLRQRAGTKSKICFIISGDRGDTGVRVLDDGRGKFFDRGALRHFILSTNTALGPLNFIRIWHDNSGEGSYASWFLDKIIVEDLQTKIRYLFLNGKWLAADEEDGQVDRSIPVAGEEEVDGFEHLFFSTARKNLTDEHLWISVLSRPTKSHFSRAQRLTCCLTLLFTTMLASAMFYQGTPEQEENQKGDQVVRLGPIVLSVQTILISIYANLLVVPINLIIVQFFRKSKPKHYIDMEEAEKIALKEEMKRQRYMRTATPVPEPTEKDEQKEEDVDADNKDKDQANDKKEKKKKTKKWPKYPLPWWCSIVAWVVAVLSCAVSMFIVFMYSLEWGKLVSEEWLSSLLFSFVQSVIVIQPLKVVAVAMLVSLIFKKYTGEEEDEEDEMNKARLASDEELLTPTDVELSQLAVPPAPTAAALAEARAKSAADKKMWDTIKEIVIYLLFLLLVAFIAWGPRNSSMFDISDNIRGYMAGSDKLYAPYNNETIGFLGDHFRFWLWVNTTVVDMLFNTAHYNDRPTTRRDRLFMRDQVSFRVGSVRLRQLRIPPARCDLTEEMLGIITECNIGYEIYKEEDRNYTAGWWLESANSTEPEPGSIDLAFKYHSMLELHSFPLFGRLATYGGGGYLADLSTSPRRARKAIDQLMQANWIDYYTRAIIVEYTIYNPNVNLFAHTSYIIEFPPTGSCIATPKIAVFQIYAGVGGMGTAVMVAQIIYIFVMLYFMVKAIKDIRKLGSKAYFAEPWNIYEMAVIVSSIVCIAMFGMKEAIGRLVTSELSERSEYGSYLQLATYIELVDYTVGFIVFMANIKFLRLLRFNNHVQELGTTFRRAGKELIYFGVTFFIVFASFSLSAMGLFGAQLFDFQDFIHTLQSLYGIILGRITFVAMRNVQPILGPLFFFVFLMAVYFILVNMFVTILTNAYTEVRLSNMKNENDAVVSLLLQRMKSGFGLQKTNRDTGAGYVEATDLLDRRLDLINTWINEHCKEEAHLKKAAMGKGSIFKKSDLQPKQRKPSISSKLAF